MVVVVRLLAKPPSHQSILIPLLLFAILFHSSFCSPIPNENGDFYVLLAFKSASDTSNSLISWSNSSSPDPCSAWLGITCHPTTRRVTKLVLNNLNLTGSAQVLSRLPQLRHLSLQHNRLSVTPDFAAWPGLKHLYLSHNHFTGGFPPGIPRLRRLRRLALSYNDFSGEIPVSQLSRLAHLLTLRLEFNWFNGTLGSDNPSSTLRSLADFNVSENALAGKIPAWLSKFPASSFAGNARLCGEPLQSRCPIKPAVVIPGRGPLPFGVTDVKKKKSSKNVTVLMIVLIDAAAAAAILSLVAFCCYRRRYSGRVKERKKSTSAKGYGTTRGARAGSGGGEMVCFDGCNGFARVDELLKASAEMLGKGCVGTTYRVELDHGDVVVVKRVRDKPWRIKDTDGLLREIGGLRHPNVVSLRAYYSSKEELLLVYDFLQNGSLHNLLHGMFVLCSNMQHISESR